jgi:uncharacterized protein YcnI
MISKTLALTVGGIVLFTMPLAWGHVTVSPKETPSGAEQRYCIRVPSEKPLPTVSLEVEFPVNLAVSEVEAPPGWRAAARKDRQGRIVSGSWDGGAIPPRQVLEFGVVAHNPETSMTLTWKAIQKYQDGSEVHWIGPSRAQFPAATTNVQQRPGVPGPAVACLQESSPSSGAH